MTMSMKNTGNEGFTLHADVYLLLKCMWYAMYMPYYNE